MTTALDNHVQNLLIEAAKKAKLKNPRIGLRPVDRLPSGSLWLDWALGGGWPIGRISEILGEPSTGKSILCAFAIKQLLETKPDASIAYIDTEMSVMSRWLEQLGVTEEMQKRIGFIQLNAAEDVFNLMTVLYEQNQYDLIVLDSVGAMSLRTLIQGDADTNTYGGIAKELGKFLSTRRVLITESKAATLFVNQLTTMIGGDPYSKYAIRMGHGQTQTTVYLAKGGKALFYEDAVRVLLGRKDTKDKEGNLLNYDFTIKVLKNKTAAPYRKCEIPFVSFGVDSVTGEIIPVNRVDTFRELASLGKLLGIFHNTKGETTFTNGNWHYEGVLMGRSEDSVREWLSNNIDVAEQIITRIRSRIQETYDSSTLVNELPEDSDISMYTEELEGTLEEVVSENDD